MIDARDMDLLFQALAHASRRRILDIVKAKPGIAVGALASRFDSTRIAVMKHITVLEQAGLLYSEKDGRTRRLYFNAVPIQMIYDRWTTEYSAYWTGQVAAIKYRAEARLERQEKQKREKRK